MLTFNKALECKNFKLFCLLDTSEFFVNCHKKQLYNVPFKELFLKYCPFIRIWKHYLSGVLFLVEILNVLFPRLCDCCRRTYLSNKTFAVDYIKTKSILTYSPTWQQHNNINDCYSVCVRGNKYDGTITWTNTDITTNYFELNNTEWISNKTKNPNKYINDKNAKLCFISLPGSAFCTVCP